MTVTKVSETRNTAQRGAELGPVLALDFLLARASRLALRANVAALAAKTCRRCEAISVPLEPGHRHGPWKKDAGARYTRGVKRPVTGVPPRSKTWVRLRLHIFHDARSAVLTIPARYLRLYATCFAGPPGDSRELVKGVPSPGVGWLFAPNGEPYDAERLAAETGLTQPQVQAALKQLRQERLFVKSDAGVWGVDDIDAATGITPAAQRKRKSRRSTASDRAEAA